MSLVSLSSEFFRFMLTFQIPFRNSFPSVEDG
jgi:hypothetical protein